MTTLRGWLSRLLATVRPGRSNADLENELRLHLELVTEEELNRGRAPREARQSALARSGDAARALDALRDQRDLPRLRDAVQDLRHASRSLRRAPGFAFMAVITLASGLGATATVFSAVDALFIRPLAVTAPHELFVVRRGGEALTRFPLDFYRALEESRTAFADPVASFTFPVTLTVSGAADRARAAFVTPNYFDALGLQPTVGRLLQPGDSGDAIVISHRLWRQQFAGRRSVVGEAVRIGASPFVIGGVAPPGFGGLQLDIALDLWLPMSAASTAVPLPSFRPSVDIVGRLTTPLSPEAATSLVNAAYERWKVTSSPPPRGLSQPLVLVSASHGLESRVREQFRASLGLLVGICVCLWVVTIVNVSGLLTARLGERSREIALRHVLGATSSRLFVQILTEVAVLVSGGLLLGCAVTVALSSAIPRWLPSWAGIDLHVSPRVLAVTAATAALTAFAISILQSSSIRRPSLLGHLAPAVVRFGAGRRFRLSTCLVGVQLAVTLPLIVVASLLAQSLHHLGRVDTGFERRNLLQIGVEPALVGYTAERASAYYAALTGQLRAVPGIVDASVSSGGALSGYGGFARLQHDGGWHDVATNAVDERYFSTMGIPLVSGRPFDAAEARGNAAVVIVNDAFARRIFARPERAIGQLVTFDIGGAGDRRTIVGVVENTADASLRERATPTAYLPVAGSSLLMVHVRSANAVETAGAIRRTATSLDPRVPILSIRTIEARLQNALQRERLLAATSVAISWVALALSAIGLFGRVSRDVIARTREMVIRSALGATPFQIANLFLTETMRLLLLSVVAGAGAAVVAARAVRGQMYGVSSTDLSSYLGGAALLIAVATIATIWPLRRAWRAGESTQLLRL